LWAQNDEAGQKWLSDAQNTLSGRCVSVARLPEGFKDVGDFIKAGVSVEELRNAFKKEMVPMTRRAFPVMESLIASEWERELKQEFYRIHEERIYRAQSIEHEVYYD
jgi:hypothetical protein